MRNEPPPDKRLGRCDRDRRERWQPPIRRRTVLVVLALCLVLAVAVCWLLGLTSAWFGWSWGGETLEWRLQAAGYSEPPVPSKEELVAKCGLADFGFTADGVRIPKQPGPGFPIKEVVDRLESRLPDQFPAVFKKGGESNIADVTIQLPATTSANDEQKVLTISIERKSDREISLAEKHSNDRIKTEITDYVEPFEEEIYTKVVDISTQDLLRNTLPLGSEKDVVLLTQIEAEYARLKYQWKIPPRIGNVQIEGHEKVRMMEANQFTGNEYDASYTIWIEALNAMKFRRVASPNYYADWDARTKALEELAEAYVSGLKQPHSRVAGGRFNMYRVDGSVLALAEYTLLSLYLDGYGANFQEAPGTQPIYQALGLGDKNNQGVGSRFCRTASHLLRAVRLLEGTGEAVPPGAVLGLNYTPGRGQSMSLLGGRMMYYPLAAIVELESALEGDAERAAAVQKAKSLMHQGMLCRNQFIANLPEKVNTYLYCYLVWGGMANARVCVTIDADNWRAEWIDFVKLINGKVRVPRPGMGPENNLFSDYYYFLGLLAVHNALVDEAGSRSNWGLNRQQPGGK